MENASKGSIICSKTNIVRIAMDKIVIDKRRGENSGKRREEEKRKEITGGSCCEEY